MDTGGVKDKVDHEELCWPLSTLVHEHTLLLARDGCWDTLKFKGPVNFCRAPGWFACTLHTGHLLTEGHLSLRLDVNSRNTLLSSDPLSCNRYTAGCSNGRRTQWS